MLKKTNKLGWVLWRVSLLVAFSMKGVISKGKD